MCFGERGTLADDWFFGLRLETSANSRSTNVTIGDEATGGPFSKGSDGINVGQAYLGYKGFHDITLTGVRPGIVYYLRAARLFQTGTTALSLIAKSASLPKTPDSGSRRAEKQAAVFELPE